VKLEALRLLEHIHGHLGWLAVAALVHPAIVLRNPKRRARLAVTLSVALATLAGALGGYLYFYYSLVLRRAIYVASVRHGLMFERKEHLAFGAIALAWAGCVMHWTARDAEGDPDARAKFAHYAFVMAAAISLVVAVMGTIVGSFKTF
jgi:hypothetical protein